VGANLYQKFQILTIFGSLSLQLYTYNCKIWHAEAEQSALLAKVRKNCSWGFAPCGQIYNKRPQAHMSTPIAVTFFTREESYGLINPTKIGKFIGKYFDGLGGCSQTLRTESWNLAKEKNCIVLTEKLSNAHVLPVLHCHGGWCFDRLFLVAFPRNYNAHQEKCGSIAYCRIYD